MIEKVRMLHATCLGYKRIWTNRYLRFRDDKRSTNPMQWHDNVAHLKINHWTREIAISCESPNGGGGIIAAISDGKVSDQSWLCGDQRGFKPKTPEFWLIFASLEPAKIIDEKAISKAGIKFFHENFAI